MISIDDLDRLLARMLKDGLQSLEVSEGNTRICLRLPDAPLPNAAPMSAPLPCCSNTNPQIATAISKCTTSNTVSSMFIRYSSAARLGTGDRQEFRRLEGRTTNQSTVYVRHRE